MRKKKKAARKRLFLFAEIVEKLGFARLVGFGGLRMLSLTSLETPSSLAAVVGALDGD